MSNRTAASVSNQPIAGLPNRTAARTGRTHLALVPPTTRTLVDTAAPSPDSWDDRRSSIRRTLSELAGLTHVRLKYGPTVSLLDLSAGGAQIEATSYRFQPGATVVMQIATESEVFAVPSLVLRSQVSRILPAGATYRTALAFKRRFDLPDLALTERSDRDLDLAREHAELNVALRRLEGSMALLGGSTGPGLTGVGRGAVAATLAIMASPSGRRASGAFSREMGRLFRIVTSGLSKGTAPHVILGEMVEGMRRAVPAEVIRVVNGSSLVGIPPEAIYFEVPSPSGGCAARLVVEFPRGCRLDSWHLSFLKAAAHLVTLISEIDRMIGARNPAAAVETTCDLPVGWKRLVVRHLDGRLLKGFTTDFAAAKGHVHVWADPNGLEASRTTVPMSQLKAIFFVHDLEGDPARRPSEDTAIEFGRRIEVTFEDGEVLAGTTLSYSADGRGFFVTPLDTAGNNVRIFVAPGAVRHVKFP